MQKPLRDRLDDDDQLCVIHKFIDFPVLFGIFFLFAVLRYLVDPIFAEIHWMELLLFTISTSSLVTISVFPTKADFNKKQNNNNTN